MIKKIVTLLLVLVCTSGAVFSQIDKGAFLTRFSVNNNKATLNYEGNINNHIKGNTYALAPGYAIKNNLVLGLFGGLGHYKTETISAFTTAQTKSKNYVAGAFIKMYRSLPNRFFVFGEASLSHAWNDVTSQHHYQPVNGPEQVTNYAAKGNNSNASFKPGIAYQVFSGLQFELLLPDLLVVGYNRSKTESEGKTNTAKSWNAFTGLDKHPLKQLSFGATLLL
ncbi:hypothetical protein LL912_08730 [Niabella sp. CC-SYL272]|uniref:hypothetical protein n=1 Tax=Niabella agricola TaxID=2891571 RepID=UPI001F3E34CA|nr:hypothetical protein [Niabella agricola]MCF3108860.1 hypothetical protein [Niabella agricola]